MPAFGLVTVGALTVGKGIYDAVSGASKYKKGKKELDAMSNEFYKVQDGYQKRENLAASLAENGMPAAQRDYYTTETQRGLGSALEASDNLGGNPNDVSSILDTYMRNIGATAAQDAAQHTANIGTFMKYQQDNDAQKSIADFYNRIKPNLDKRALISQQMGINKQKQEAGFNTIIGGLTGAVTGFQNQALIDAMKTKNHSGYATTDPPFVPQQTQSVPLSINNMGTVDRPAPPSMQLSFSNEYANTNVPNRDNGAWGVSTPAPVQQYPTYNLWQ